MMMRVDKTRIDETTRRIDACIGIGTIFSDIGNRRPVYKQVLAVKDAILIVNGDNCSGIFDKRSHTVFPHIGFAVVPNPRNDGKPAAGRTGAR